MKAKCLILLLLLVTLSSGALAQRPSRPPKPSGSQSSGNSSSSKKEEFNIWDYDEKDLDDEDRKRLESLKEEAKQDRLDKMRREAVPKAKQHDNNTVCSFGPQFRDVSPRMTKEWYMFTPIDLSREGKQTFDLIAGNMYVVGQVTVTVENGKFQVDYEYNNSRIKSGREYFNIFPDYESIKEKDLDQLKKRFDYGRAYDIQQKLDGDTDVILFVCNTASFNKNSGVGGYFKTHPDRVAEREAMLEMIGKTEKTSGEN